MTSGKTRQWPPRRSRKKTSARKPKPKPKRKTRTEKEDREEIFEALEKLGHEPFYQVLDGRPQCLTALAKCDADLVFNLTESFAGDDTKEMNVAAYMDLLEIPYTGGGPHAHFLAQDKGTAKKIDLLQRRRGTPASIAIDLGDIVNLAAFGSGPVRHLRRLSDR